MDSVESVRAKGEPSLCQVSAENICVLHTTRVFYYIIELQK
jgi:hypothetical protein